MDAPAGAPADQLDPPAEPPPAPEAPTQPPGIREQVRRTIRAGRRLAQGHVDLAKAELSAIMWDVGRVAALGGMALALVLFVGLLVPIGMALFLGEWLFGSMGWGILHGTLFFVGTAVVLVLAALRISGSYLTRALAVAILIGIAVSIVLGLAWPNAAYTSIGTSVVPGIEAGVRPLVVGIAVGAAIVGLLGLLLGARVGRASGAVGGLVGGALLGALAGAFTAISFSLQVGIALGISAGLVAWPILAALALRGYDWEELKRRFVPQASIDAARETKAFVEARLPRKKEEEA